MVLQIRHPIRRIHFILWLITYRIHNFFEDAVNYPFIILFGYDDLSRFLRKMYRENTIKEKKKEVLSGAD
jgi:hypothetical protein